MLHTFSEKRFFEWHEDDKCVTLRAKSGSYGGGSEVLVVDDEMDIRCPWERHGGSVPYNYRRPSGQDNGLHSNSGRR